MARFKLNRRQITTILSVIYLLSLTILAAYALHLCNYYSLPIPNVHTALTVALPPLAGVILSLLTTLTTHLTKTNRTLSPFPILIPTALSLILLTLLATLAGTHIAPLGGLQCPLQQQWSTLFRAKDSQSIVRIQDALSCCGFNAVQDRAWPFPDKTHGNDACVVRYERDRACLEPWRGVERKVAVMLLVVPLGVFLWECALFFAMGGGGGKEGLLPSVIRLPEENGGEVGGRQAIMYRDIEEEGGNEEDSLREEVGRLNQDSSLATHVMGSAGRVRPSPLIQQQEAEGNMWARD